MSDTANGGPTSRKQPDRPLVYRVLLLKTLQVYRVAATCFLVLPVAIAGGFGSQLLFTVSYGVVLLIPWFGLVMLSIAAGQGINAGRRTSCWAFVGCLSGIGIVLAWVGHRQTRFPAWTPALYSHALGDAAFAVFVAILLLKKGPGIDVLTMPTAATTTSKNMPDEFSRLASSKIVKIFLVVVLLAGLTALLIGLGLASYANSPRNRSGNDFADIGVAMGVALSIAGGVVTVVSSAALVLRARRNR